MTDWGWGPALILGLGILLVVFGILAFISEMIRKDRAHKRAMRRFEASQPDRNSRYSIMRDLKDLNS